MLTWLVKSGIKAAEVANTVGKVVTVAAVASDLIKAADTVDADPSKEKKLDGSSESGISTSIVAPPSEDDLGTNMNSAYGADENETNKKDSGRSEAWKDASWTPEESKSNSYLLPTIIFALIALTMIWFSSSL